MTDARLNRDLDEYFESQADRPWKGRIRITFQNLPDADTVIECDFDLDHAHDEEDAIEQIKDTIAHQTHIQIL